jgi:hypothetical protein
MHTRPKGTEVNLRIWIYIEYNIDSPLLSPMDAPTMVVEYFLRASSTSPPLETVGFSPFRPHSIRVRRSIWMRGGGKFLAFIQVAWTTVFSHMARSMIFLLDSVAILVLPTLSSVPSSVREKNHFIDKTVKKTLNFEDDGNTALWYFISSERKLKIF